MILPPTPCPGCGRLYGHLNDCRVKALHSAVDAAVAEFGVNAVDVIALPKSSALPRDRGSVESVRARRAELSREYLALDHAYSDRGLEIAAEFGQLDEEESFLEAKAAQRPIQEPQAQTSAVNPRTCHGKDV